MKDTSQTQEAPITKPMIREEVKASIFSFYLLDYLLHVACQEKFFFALENCLLKTIISIIPADSFRVIKRKREAFSSQPRVIFAHKD